MTGARTEETTGKFLNLEGCILILVDAGKEREGLAGEKDDERDGDLIYLLLCF